MPPPCKDRRVKRTESSLHRSFNALILEKGYGATTIRDITAHANVGRSTLYAHHGGKEGLMLSGFDHLRAALLADRNRRDGAHSEAVAPLGFTRTYFEHVGEYRDVFKALRQGEARDAAMSRLRRILMEIVRREGAPSRAVARERAIPFRFWAGFLVDALISVTLFWLEDEPWRVPAEIDAHFRELVVPGLVAAGCI